MAQNDGRFRFDEVHKLESPERLDLQPPDRVVDALDLAPDSQVLDFGAGSGYFSIPIAMVLDGLGGTGRVITLDVEPRMLTRLHARAGKAQVQHRLDDLLHDADGDSTIPLPTESVDRVLMANVHHELRKMDPVLEQLNTVLRPEGFLLVVDWSPEGTLESGPPRHKRVPEEVIIADLRRAGFDPVEAMDLYDSFSVVRGVKPVAEDSTGS